MDVLFLKEDKVVSIDDVIRYDPVSRGLLEGTRRVVQRNMGTD